MPIMIHNIARVQITAKPTPVKRLRRNPYGCQTCIMFEPESKYQQTQLQPNPYAVPRADANRALFSGQSLNTSKPNSSKTLTRYPIRMPIVHHILTRIKIPANPTPVRHVRETPYGSSHTLNTSNTNSSRTLTRYPIRDANSSPYSSQSLNTSKPNSSQTLTRYPIQMPNVHHTRVKI